MGYRRRWGIGLFVFSALFLAALAGLLYNSIVGYRLAEHCKRLFDICNITSCSFLAVTACTIPSQDQYIACSQYNFSLVIEVNGVDYYGADTVKYPAFRTICWNNTLQIDSEQSCYYDPDNIAATLALSKKCDPLWLNWILMAVGLGVTYALLVGIVSAVCLIRKRAQQMGYETF